MLFVVMSSILLEIIQMYKNHQLCLETVPRFYAKTWDRGKTLLLILNWLFFLWIV